MTHFRPVDILDGLGMYTPYFFEGMTSSSQECIDIAKKITDERKKKADIELDYILQRARREISWGQANAVYAKFQKAAENDRCPGVARFMLGVALEHEKRYAEAMEAYWQAALLAERDWGVVSNYQFNFSPLMRILIPNRAQRESLRAKSIQNYEQSFKDDEAIRYFAIGKRYCEDSLFAEGIATFKKGVEKVPNDPDLRYVVGLTLERIGQPDSAITEYETIINLAPQYRRVYPTLGYLYYKRGSPRKAKQVMIAYLGLPNGKDSKAARRLIERLL